MHHVTNQDYCANLENYHFSEAAESFSDNAKSKMIDSYLSS